MPDRADVVIVAYRSERHLPACLDALQLLGWHGDIVVVDHADGLSAVLAEARGAVGIEDPSNPGFGAGQNRGLAKTASPYVLMLNPDAVVDASGMRRGLAYLQAHPGVAAVQGVIRNGATGDVERSQGAELGPLHLWGRTVGARRLLRWPIARALARRVKSVRDHAERVPAEPVTVPYLAATAIVARREALESVGGFDERYFLYGEDLDLCRRLRRAGWELAALPWQFATHENGGSAATMWDRELEWWRGTMTFAARWWTAAAWSSALLAAACRAVILTVQRPRRARDVFAAFVCEPVRSRSVR